MVDGASAAVVTHRTAESERDATRPEYLTICLDDHLAAFADDVAADVDALRALMQTISIEPSRLKRGLASVAEELGALKPDGRLTERSPLLPIARLEAMQMAARDTRSLWETLLVAAPAATAIEPVSLRV